jgi:hypothetical protein
MFVKTKNSLYEFDNSVCGFRKIFPTIGPWLPYVGLVEDPMVGERLEIVQDTEKSIITSTVIEIIDY